MSRRLADITVGALKTSTIKRTRQAELPTLAPAVSQLTLEAAEIPEFQLLQQIPGIKPFLTVDLIPDLINILQYEGIKGLLDQLFPVQLEPEGQDIINEPASINPEVIIYQKKRENIETAFRIGDLEGAIIQIISPGTEPPPPETASIIELKANYKEQIYNLGVQRMTIIVSRANPKNPNSIIFDHSTQNVHRDTEKVEVELILNEPEIVESDVIQCVCGSRRIRTHKVQTRSADEPETVFASCVTCKRNWKFSSA